MYNTLSLYKKCDDIFEHTSYFIRSSNYTQHSEGNNSPDVALWKKQKPIYSRNHVYPHGGVVGLCLRSIASSALAYSSSTVAC